MILHLVWETSSLNEKNPSRMSKSMYDRKLLLFVFFSLLPIGKAYVTIFDLAIK